MVLNEEYEAAAFIIVTLLGCALLAVILPPLLGKLLHALKLSHISTRPFHPKSDVEVQDAFKKTSRLKSQKFSPDMPPESASTPKSGCAMPSHTAILPAIGLLLGAIWEMSAQGQRRLRRCSIE